MVCLPNGDYTVPMDTTRIKAKPPYWVADQRSGFPKCDPPTTESAAVYVVNQCYDHEGEETRWAGFKLGEAQLFVEQHLEHPSNSLFYVHIYKCTPKPVEMWFKLNGRWRVSMRDEKDRYWMPVNPAWPANEHNERLKG